MEQKESLYDSFTKMIQLKKQIAAINSRKSAEDHNKLISGIDNKLERFVDTMKYINDNQKNLNAKQLKIIYTVQDNSLLLSDNSVQLSYTHHEKFIYMIKSKEILDKLLDRLQTHTDKCDDLHFIINQFKEVHTSLHNEFIENLCEFRSTKGLLNNIKELKEFDWKDSTSILEQKSATDSDLGCYPNDSNLNVQSQFATSSPISLIRFDDA